MNKRMPFHSQSSVQPQYQDENTFAHPQKMDQESMFPQDAEMSYDQENQALAMVSNNHGLMDLLTINSQDE